MKKLDRLILKSFLGPLLLTFAIAVFVLLMQFVWKYIDDLVGKGLEFSVIAQLLMYASATFVPMALPIAVLFASIMTMGNFGEKYELVAMKAGGVSLSRVMLPMAVVSLLLVGVAFYFSNNVLPVAMYKYRTTLYDVQRKKPAVNIRPSEYYTDIDNYVIRVNGKDNDGRTLRDIIIYDHQQGITNTNIIVADSGYMQSTPDDHYLVFTLKNGHTYSESEDGNNYESRPLTCVKFDEQELVFDISSFGFEKSNDKFFEGHYQMLNVVQLDSMIGVLESNNDHKYVECKRNTQDNLKAYQQLGKINTDSIQYEDVLRKIDKEMDVTERVKVYDQAKIIASNMTNNARMYEQLIKADQEYINRHYIELMRKFTLSVACLLLFLIGAPFGSIVRKGGLGMPLVASVIFFVMYYVIGMISEKSVRESAMGPVGMWMSTFVFIPIGILLTWQATTDSSLFDLATWKRWLHIKNKGKAVVQKIKQDTLSDTFKEE